MPVHTLMVGLFPGGGIRIGDRGSFLPLAPPAFSAQLPPVDSSSAAAEHASVFIDSISI